MTEKDVIIVQPSVQLTKMRLEQLVGRTMEVVEIVRSGKDSIAGCWASLTKGDFLGEKEWFIPRESIQTTT